MEKYYFTYGREGYPFAGGWTEVYADDLQQAIRVFRAFHPDKIKGMINCSDYYDAKHMPLELKENGNYSAYCHEVIGKQFPEKEQINRILDEFRDSAYASMLREKDVKTQTQLYLEYISVVDFAVRTGLIGLADGFERQTAALKEVEAYKRKVACCFCDKLIPERDSNNAAPLVDGRCCDDCNVKIVIPYRIAKLQGGGVDA